MSSKLHVRWVQNTSGATTTAVAISAEKGGLSWCVERATDWFKAYLLSKAKFGFPSLLFASGVALLLKDNPLAWSAAQAVAELGGIKLPSLEVNTLAITVLGHTAAWSGLFLEGWAFIAPLLRPVKSLYLHYSYQPMHAALMKRIINAIEPSWVRPIHIDQRFHSVLDGTNLESAYTALLKIARTAQRDREIFYCGIAYIPLVARLGFLLRNYKIGFFEINHTTKEPVYLPQGQPKGLVFQQSRSGAVGAEMALIVELTSAVDDALVAKAVGEKIPSVRLSLSQRGYSKIESAEDLLTLTTAIRDVITKAAEDNPQLRTIHLFYAGQTSLAFRLGQTLSENTDPEVLAYNYHRDSGGYNWAAVVNKGGRVVRLS